VGEHKHFFIEPATALLPVAATSVGACPVSVSTACKTSHLRYTTKFLLTQGTPGG